ncbi:MAG: hypothetical protein DWB56_12365 [Candidatus Jettenia sp.]|uniref:Uncharacterized protein n=1 Tax=Candidatus Jettenia caeni TaxID=247490 RepID=I3IPA9_9BACT|nr:hypothetical protein [Candidatus Jettenia sp. AMX1]MBC6929730.1 hypothetical protein [Candidatus Jettenia sp.]NUN23751.1 hypothetical protein [Candidatus Jettenia caeni]KAA0248729.1 MAG: hypothetical protein EDM77_11570 [Candidatus Jettenia sp. AMX1]MCE7880646.1 hypothetical protein [Candidatus Jettenia sp. AMX1]MCQ3927390.1 hypothetical protein [Candidatus Jettenia sp.]
MAIELSLKDLTDAIEHLNQQEQKILLSKLLSLQKLSLDDLSLLKVAEPSFDFWDNPEDSIYDNL